LGGGFGGGAAGEAQEEEQGEEEQEEEQEAWSDAGNVMWGSRHVDEEGTGCEDRGCVWGGSWVGGGEARPGAGPGSWMEGGMAEKRRLV
jgi:hypothetical protein